MRKESEFETPKLPFQVVSHVIERCKFQEGSMNTHLGATSCHLLVGQPRVRAAAAAFQQ